jgi:hypothetical protein
VVSRHSASALRVGHDNEEGIASGAWWFYYRLGFRPRAAAPRRVLREELAKMRKNPAHRSSAATLRQLADGHMLFEFEPGRTPTLPPLRRIGLRVAEVLAARAGTDGDRGRALAACVAEALQLTGVRSLRGSTPDERLAWRRWSPLLLAIPGVSRWSVAERRALAKSSPPRLTPGDRCCATPIRSCNEHDGRHRADPTIGRSRLAPPG